MWSGSPARNFTTALVKELAGPAVASGPEWANGTSGSFVIDAFFVWTADNSVCHHDGPGSGRVDECEHFFRNAGIVANIGPFGEPASKVHNVGILGRHDADSELGGSGIVWAIERDGSDGVSAKSSLGSFVQPFARPLDHAVVVARLGPSVKGPDKPGSSAATCGIERISFTALRYSQSRKTAPLSTMCLASLLAGAEIVVGQYLACWGSRLRDSRSVAVGATTPSVACG